MVHIRKQKGDIATAKIIADLTEKGYIVFTPTVCESMPFDLIAYKNNICYRIQAKYSSTGTVQNIRTWNDKHGTHTIKYEESDFDYYGIYLSKFDKIVYPSIKFGGAKITVKIGNSPTPFYWWEDFLEFSDDVSKKTYKDFGYKITREETKSTKAAHIKNRKVDRPSKENLEKLLWEKPTAQLANIFGVSDKAVEKWAKAYGISKPPRGYWTKKKFETKLGS